MNNEDQELGELKCSGCGHDYTHHNQVRVYNRGEDSTSGMRAIVDWDTVTVDDKLSGNPSSRRHGVSILFSCESCNALSELAIYQVKGMTLLSVRNAGFRLGVDQCHT
jgi:hypothetical protein